MSNNRFYVLTGMVIAIAISISLYYANSIYGNMNSADEESVVETCVLWYKENVLNQFH